ncbi:MULTISPECIES: metal-dependent transcriptional regulator [Pseudarthrobacter]|uniref:metal-dependent transcriptional regulator n=1 Tax=Pseudarthrobacter TaxID=1742993 RepID=UPI00344C1DD4
MQTLGYTWDEIHDEAAKLEHAASEHLIATMDELLEHPSAVPHGDPIPTVDGQMRRPGASQLTAAQPGQNVVICRVSDADPKLLRYFSGLGLSPGTELTIRERKPFTTGTTFHVTRSGQAIMLGTEATEAVWVSPPAAGIPHPGKPGCPNRLAGDAENAGQAHDQCRVGQRLPVAPKSPSPDPNDTGGQYCPQIWWSTKWN